MYGRDFSRGHFNQHTRVTGAITVGEQSWTIDGAGWQASGANFSGLRAWDDAQWTAAREAIQATNAKDRAARTV